MIFGESIDQQVVDYSACGRGKRGILRLSIDQLRRVVGRQPVNKWNRVLPTRVDFAHVRHIKQSGARACPQMFSNGTRGILHRHLPASKLNHASAESTVRIIECGLLEVRRGRSHADSLTWISLRKRSI